MMQPTESVVRNNRPGFCRTGPSRRCSLPESEVRAVLAVQLDNATPIILNCEKSVTLGTLGTLAQ
jgi:hypothetical protein